MFLYIKTVKNFFIMFRNAATDNSETAFFPSRHMTKLGFLPLVEILYHAIANTFLIPPPPAQIRSVSEENLRGR